MSRHIPLDRRFEPFDPELQGERGDHSYGLGLISWPGEGWQEILTGPGCSVIVAEARSGKTAEFQHQTRLLRSAAKPAFLRVSSCWQTSR